MKKNLLEGTVFIIAVLLVQFVSSKYKGEEKEADVRIEYYEKEEVRFESYVFVDEIGTLHTDSRCVGLQNASNYQQPVWRELWKLTASDIEKICSRCVSEEQSEKMRKITGVSNM